MDNFQLIFLKIIRENALNPIHYEKGVYLFREDDCNNHIFFILKGSVLIMKSHLILWQAMDNELIGITSFFSKKKQCHFTAKLNKDSTLFIIPNEILEKELITNFEFSRSVMTLLCDRINHIDHRIKDFLDLPSKVRLLRTIVRITRETKTRTIIYQIDEFASLVGISKRIVRKILLELEDRKLIRIIQNKLEVIDMRGIEIISGL